MRAAQDTTGDKRPFTHDRIDLAENTPRELYSLLALYVGSPKKESFSERPNIQWVYVWRVYWAEIFEWEAKRPCLLLLDLEYTSNTVNMGGWMGTCVIAADMLNEGYQSVEVWQEEKVRRGERREEREPEKRRWKTSPKESDREKEHVELGDTSRWAASRQTGPRNVSITVVQWWTRPVCAFPHNSDACVGQREVGLRLIGIQTSFRGARGLWQLLEETGDAAVPPTQEESKMGEGKKGGGRLKVHLRASFEVVTQVLLCLCEFSLPVCVCVCLYSCIYMWEPAHFQHGEVSVCFVSDCFHHSRYSAGCVHNIKHWQQNKQFQNVSEISYDTYKHVVGWHTQRSIDTSINSLLGHFYNNKD